MADTCDRNATNNAEETRSDALGMLITSDLFRLFFSLCGAARAHAHGRAVLLHVRSYVNVVQEYKLLAKVVRTYVRSR